MITSMKFFLLTIIIYIISRLLKDIFGHLTKDFTLSCAIRVKKWLKLTATTISKLRLDTWIWRCSVAFIDGFTRFPIWQINHLKINPLCEIFMAKMLTHKVKNINPFIVLEILDTRILRTVILNTDWNNEISIFQYSSGHEGVTKRADSYIIIWVVIVPISGTKMLLNRVNAINFKIIELTFQKIIVSGMCTKLKVWPP